MKKRFIFILLLAIAVIVSCCSKRRTSKEEEDFLLKTDSTTKRSNITIVVPGTPDAENEKILEQLIHEQGFNVDIEVFNRTTKYLDYERYIEHFKNAVKKNPNAMIVLDGGISNIVVERYGNLIMDLSKIYRKSAPKHYEQFYGNTKDKVYEIPLSHENDSTPKRLAVLVTSSLMKEYGKQITTAAEYEDYLAWAAESHKELTPGFMPLLLYEGAYDNSYTPFELFAPEFGLYSISKVLPINIGGIYTDISSDNTDKLNIYALETLPQFKESMLRLRSLVDKGWLYVQAAQNMSGFAADKYSSIIVNTGDYVFQNIGQMFPQLSYPIDASKYSINILYPDRVPEVWEGIPSIKFGGYINKGAKNPEAILAFVQWLYDSKQDNYKLFRYGDPSTKTNDNPEYSNWNILNYFLVPEWEKPQSIIPENWNEAIGRISGNRNTILRDLAGNQAQMNESLLKNFSQDDSKKVGDREKRYTSFFDNLLIFKREDPVKYIDSFIDQLTSGGYDKYIEDKVSKIIKAGSK
jgi:hypothetical protein